jgi:uncharacterized membrane protein
MTELNKTISRVLTIGLLVSVVLLLIGVVLTLARPGLAAVHLTSLERIPAAIGGLEPGGFFDLGLLILVLNPVARVIALAAGFGRRRMWFFTLVSLFVLVVLALSVYIGLVA